MSIVASGFKSTINLAESLLLRVPVQKRDRPGAPTQLRSSATEHEGNLLFRYCTGDEDPGCPHR